MVHDKMLQVNESAGLLGNDRDRDDDPLTARLLGPSDGKPAPQGTVTLELDGSFTDPTSVIYTSTPILPDKVLVRTEDSPSTSALNDFVALDKLDVKYSFRTYLVVKYADNALYVLAYWDWEVNFYATTNVPGSGVSVIAAASKVSAAPNWVRSNWDPWTTAGPIGNGNVEWR